LVTDELIHGQGATKTGGWIRYITFFCEATVDFDDQFAQICVFFVGVDMLVDSLNQFNYSLAGLCAAWESAQSVSDGKYFMSIVD
jgi:hypothetical protein